MKAKKGDMLQAALGVFVAGVLSVLSVTCYTTWQQAREIGLQSISENVEYARSHSRATAHYNPFSKQEIVSGVFTEPPASPKPIGHSGLVLADSGR